MKYGLVIEGGGMKCAYSAGILDRFLDKQIEFDYVIGVSAGSANAASFLAKQRGRNLRFYTKHIKNKKYFGMYSFFTTGSIFGLDYIYTDLTNSDGVDPIDYHAIMNNPADFEIVVTNAETGKAEYISKYDMVEDDYECFKASSCIPAICKPRKIGDNYYYDGGISDPIPTDRAFSQGCDRLVVILSKPRDYVRTPQKFRAIYAARCRKFPKIIKAIDRRHILYMGQFRNAFELEKEGKAFVFAPEGNLESGTYKMDEEKNRALYDLGVSDFDRRMEELKAFMSDVNKGEKENDRN